MATYNGIEEILKVLPEDYRRFDDSAYPMPVSQAILGELPEVGKVRPWLAEAASGELKNMMEPVAVAAEIIESNASDRGDFFIGDDELRDLVFNGAKWQAGWILLAGESTTDEFAERLKTEQYIVFSSEHDKENEPDTQLKTTATTHKDGSYHRLPNRETQAIYFLQMMVRYAMIWGQIPPGQDHTMGHFLERDMPGAMVIKGKVGPIEGLVLLALMKMGCPAVVDPDFPYEIGPRAVARTDDEILKAISELPNMRVRIFEGDKISLPPGADPINAKEKITPARTVSGLLQIRPSDCRKGVTVLGDASSDRVAVIVEVNDPKLDLPVSAHLEAQAVRMGSYLHGVRTCCDDSGEFRIELAEGTQLDGTLLGEVIAAGLKKAYPRLGPVNVRIEFGEEAVTRESKLAVGFNQVRDVAILAESEDSEEEFYLCIDCQPFSHKHICVITADRWPMCGQSRNTIKARALWGADYRPWTRREISTDDLQYTVKRGEAIDVTAGEYVNVNQAAKELTGGMIERVRLHSVFDAPHTSCGCFGALAFRIPGTDWIGVMERGYKGTAPGSLTWSILANQAGGKQSPGVTGITPAYLKSPKAFAGDGGLVAVKWATSRIHDVMQRLLPDDSKIAVEDQATTVEELTQFIQGKR